MSNLLFNLDPVEPQKPECTCRHCVHRQRWECGGSIIQYCGLRKSNRTENGLKKIKVTDPACPAFEKETNKQ